MSNDNKKISLAVVRRLPRYYRYLYDLLQSGVTRISSRELSEKMGVTASQIRQDLNCFGGFGQQGYGYNVQNLFNEISKILGTDHRFNVIIIGKYGPRFGELRKLQKKRLRYYRNLRYKAGVDRDDGEQYQSHAYGRVGRVCQKQPSGYRHSFRALWTNAGYRRSIGTVRSERFVELFTDGFEASL
jgi:hypothetical protein